MRQTCTKNRRLMRRQAELGMDVPPQRPASLPEPDGTRVLMHPIMLARPKNDVRIAGMVLLTPGVGASSQVRADSIG
jgi:hypothetical protein